MQDEKRNESDPFGSDPFGSRIASIRRLVLAVLACFGFVQGAWAQSPQGRQLDDAQIAFVRALVLLYETKTIEDISIGDIESMLGVKLLRVTSDGAIGLYEIHGVPGGRPPGTPGDSVAWLTLRKGRPDLARVAILIHFSTPTCFDLEHLRSFLDLRLTRFTMPSGQVTYSTKLAPQKYSAVPKAFGIDGRGNCFDSIGVSFQYSEN